MSIVQGGGRTISGGYSQSRAACTGCSVEVPVRRLEEPGFVFPHSPECREKNLSHTDCRSAEGITVGLIDSMITSARVLKGRSMAGRAISEALKDLRSDPDVLVLIKEQSNG